MDVLKGILAEVLEEVTPSKEEERVVMSRVDAFIKKLKVKDADIILGGSGAKGTWLRNTFDIDLFVRFPKKYADKDISGILEKALKPFGCERYHGSRDYFRVRAGGFVYEIVPVINIRKSSEAFNLTDVSPLHSVWVKRNSGRALKGEIRLAKKFFKANNLYGAESYIRGFSGYVLEVLVIYYGGFVNLLKASLKWKGKQVIDLKKFHKDVFFEVNSSKLVSPLILIDPVQPGRNAAAALSLEKFNELKKLAKQFLGRPSKKFFEKPEINVDALKKKYFVLEAEVFSGKDDVVGCKVEKAFEFVSKKFEHCGFVIKKKGWSFGKFAVFYFDFESSVLPAEQVVSGPPSRIKFHAEQFRRKYKAVEEKSGVLFAKIPRLFRTPESVVAEIMNDPYLADKVKNLGVV
jgi:tRNA nucleotidyltransferase (CCA-adding enzyme)